MLTAVPAPQALAPSKPLRVTAADTQSAASPPRRANKRLVYRKARLAGREAPSEPVAEGFESAGSSG